MKNHPESVHSYYKKAIYLKYESKFMDAEEAIKEAFQKKFNEDQIIAATEKAALRNMLEEIKHAKQRNLRHLHREEIRKRKAEKMNLEIWDDAMIEGEEGWD